MKNEISEEAIAEKSRRTAIDRLKRDGAHSTAALQRRVRALAAERDIPPVDYAKLMYKRVGTPAFLAFCEKHNVSVDWLLCGDLKGLRRMTLERKLCDQAVPIADRLMQKCRNLSPVFQAIVEESVDRPLEKQK